MERMEVGERYRFLLDTGGEHPQQVTGEFVSADYDAEGRTSQFLVKVESALDSRRTAHVRWFSAARVVWWEEVQRRPEPLASRLDALLRSLSPAEVDYLEDLVDPEALEALRRVADRTVPGPAEEPAR